MAAKDHVFFCIATSYTLYIKNRHKFGNSKRLTCAFVLSGDFVCFHRRSERQNANYVAYVQMRP